MARHCETFCGCCEFKKGCIIIAVCRVLITVAATVALFVIYFEDELKEEVLQEGIVSELGLGFYRIISIPVSILTIRCSYYFIRGATSNNKADIDRMLHYFVIQLATIVALVACLNSICFFLAFIEFYLMCCSVLLIEERKDLLKEDALNDAETPPPQYNSCVYSIEPQTSVTHLEEDPSSQNAGAEPDTNHFNNAAVEAGDNHLKKAVVDPQVSPFESTMESEEILERNPFKNVGLEPKANPIQNDGVESEEIPINNLAMNPKVNP